MAGAPRKYNKDRSKGSSFDADYTSSFSAEDGVRVPPHSVEAEQSVLGGLMLDKSTWDAVADRLTAEDFYRRDHQLIFAAVADLAARSEPLDAVTLAAQLERNGQLEEGG